MQEYQWYYEINGEQKGPISETEIISLIQSKQLHQNNLVWREGFSEWISLIESELKQHLDLSSPPPLNAQPPKLPNSNGGKAHLADFFSVQAQDLTHIKVNNTLVWFVAFAPIIGEFLRGIILFALYGDAAIWALKAGEFWFVTPILNIALTYIDENQLKKAGIDTKAAFTWTTFLIPVYLYKRAILLKNNLAYFIVWIVCFVLSLFA